tara:strand:+ start:1568 stop:2050 length:483 start_codon:yes stop_codon:yes gene_type:complete
MPEAPRFVVDINVGRLATWLRVMGYDTLFPREADDSDLVRIALREGRVLVTRDAGFGRRRAVRNGQMRVVRVEADDLRSQLRQVVRELKLDPAGGFSRCVRCNEPLHSLDKKDVDGRVPPYVFRNHSRFTECPGCRRLYWRGTHWSKMIAELDQVYREAG